MASKAEKDCKWHFEESRGGSDQGPTTDSKNEQFRKYPFPSLIRESLQNSLDARKDYSEPVKVVFSFGSLNSRNYENFFDLKFHIRGIFDLYPEPQVRTKFTPMIEVLTNTYQASNRIHYLKVSDFNTRGMSYSRNGHKEEGPFYAFARCVGYNNKPSETAGGAFGIGKDAIFRISPINTLLVSSLNTEGQYMFEGVCLLCTHMYDGKKRRETGYYDNQGGFPTTNADDIPSRFKRNEELGAGTDIFIMGIEPNKKEEYILEMRRAVLRNFWLAIFKGKLEVEFKDATNPTLDCAINADNLESQIVELFTDAYDKKRQNNYTYNPRPYYEAVAKANQDKKHTLHEAVLPHLGTCRLYLNKTIGNESSDRITYMNSIDLLVFSKLSGTQYGFSGVFECLSSDGQKLIKRLENIAHNEWDANNFRTPYNEIDPMGEIIVAEYTGFIAKCINDEFLTLEDSALNIMGAEDFLFYPEDLMDADDLNDEDWNFSFGVETGNTVDEDEDDGVSITSSVKLRPGNPSVGPASKKKHGKVVMVEHATATKTEEEEPEDSENLLKGGVIHPGGGQPGQQTAPGDTNYKPDESGTPGTYRRKLKVRYRTVAKFENDKYIHGLILHSPHDVENAEIEIITRGESGDIIVPLTKTNNGVASGNMLSNVTLRKGTNLIDGIEFEDNLKHAISLTAYEIK